MCKEKKRPVHCPSELNWAVKFSWACLSDGFHPGWKPPGWKHVQCPLSISPSLPELTYCFSSSSLTGHIQKLLRQTHEKHETCSHQKLIGNKCLSCCSWHKCKGCSLSTGQHAFVPTLFFWSYQFNMNFKYKYINVQAVKMPLKMLNISFKTPNSQKNMHFCYHLGSFSSVREVEIFRHITIS